MNPSALRVHAIDLLTPWTIAELNAELENRLARAKSLESASQEYASAIYERFAATLVLARVYVLMPFYRLPARDRQFAETVARGKRVGSALRDETSCLTLMGTRGEKAEWNARGNSERHGAIPLLDARFVESVPMVASMLRALGVPLDWFDVPREVMTRRMSGGFNGLFYVDDARTARDGQGRLVIPDQGFVDGHRVRTVFGFGGSYLNGWITTAIFFSRDALAPAEIEPLSQTISPFKLATMHLIATGKLFEKR